MARRCETCERPLSRLAVRHRNPRTGAKECDECLTTASLEGDFARWLNTIEDGLGDLWAANSDEYDDRYDALPLKVRREIDGQAAAMDRMEYGGSLQVEAHDAGDGETIYHCPFCGSGNVVARSDGSAECGHCRSVFTVQVQPQHPYTPQTIDGQPYDNPDLPGQVTDPTAEGTQPQQPPEDEAAPGQESLIFTPPGMGEPFDPSKAAQPDQQVAASKTAAQVSIQCKNCGNRFDKEVPTRYERPMGVGEECPRCHSHDTERHYKWAKTAGWSDNPAGGLVWEGSNVDDDWILVARPDHSNGTWEYHGRVDGDVVADIGFSSQDAAQASADEVIKIFKGAKRWFVTANGDPLPENSYLRHLAIVYADDREQAIAQVRAEHGEHDEG